jgi:hypothetical protein
MAPIFWFTAKNMSMTAVATAGLTCLMLAMAGSVTYGFYFILCIYKPRRKYKGEEGYYDEEEEGGKQVRSVQGIPKSIDTIKSTDVHYVASGGSKWCFKVVDVPTRGGKSNKESRKEFPAPSDLHYSAPVPRFQQTFSMDSETKQPRSEKSSTKASRLLARMVGFISTTANCTEACVPQETWNENDVAKSNVQEGSLVFVDTQDLGSLVSNKEKVVNTIASNKPRDKSTNVNNMANGGAKWKFRLGKKKAKQSDIVEPYLSDTSVDESLLKGVELVKSASIKSAASLVPSSTSTDQLSESPSISLDSVNLSRSSSSSSSSSGFISFSDIQHANRTTTPVKDIVDTLTTALRPNSSISTASSSSSCDALSYVESNEAPTGQVRGLIQFEDWKDSDTVSMPAPSTAKSTEHSSGNREDLKSSNSRRIAQQQDSDDSDFDESKFQRLSDSITRKAKEMTQKEGHLESFFDEKPSQIVWERSTLTTGYHRFEDV